MVHNLIGGMVVEQKLTQPLAFIDIDIATDFNRGVIF
tara:strand:+ start:185 stop:295 length:111 start_codon:yes stop_codon:yes gene_type:complete